MKLLYTLEIASSLFVNTPQLKLSGSPNVGWDRNVCNPFPTLANAVKHVDKCSVIRPSGTCTLTSEMSIMEFVRSWRLLQLTQIMTRDFELTFRFSRDVLVRTNKMPIWPVSIAFDRDEQLLEYVKLSLVPFICTPMSGRRQGSSGLHEGGNASMTRVNDREGVTPYA